MTPEFSRPVQIDTLGAGPRALTIEANAKERRALARRFDLAGIQLLAATVTLSRDGGDIIASGTLRAQVTQSCVATGEPMDADVNEPFRILFRPQPDQAHVEEEIELDAAAMDVVYYDNGAIDIGEAVAETLALSLDPYPRAPDADDRLRKAGVLSEAQAGPFAILAGLKDRLKP